MATSVDILSAETISTSSGAVTSEEIKNLIDSADTAKQQEEEKLKAQTSQNEQTRRELVTQGDILAAESADVASAEKKSILAQTAAENEKLDSILESQETYRAVLSNNMELLEGAQERALNKQQEAFKYEQRAKGLKQNAEGDWVKMTPLERMGSMLINNWEKYDSELADEAAEEATAASLEAKNYAVNRAQIIQNMMADASSDPDYIEKQKLANDAIALTEIERLDLKQQQVVYENLEKEYGFGKEHFAELERIAAVYDEAERPRLYMQLMGLELQAKQLQLAFQEERDQNALKQAFETTYQNYLTGIGEDPETEQNKANTEIFSAFAAKGDLQGLALLSQENPIMVKDIANLYGKDTTVDVLSEMPADSLLAMGQSEDPLVQTYSQAYKANYNVEDVRADKDFVEDVAKSLKDAGIAPDSEEYSAMMQDAIAKEADKRAKNVIKLYQSNSVDTARTQGKLEPAKTSVAAYLSASLRSPEGMVSPNVANRMQHFAAYLDEEQETFIDNPERFVENYIYKMRTGGLPGTTEQGALGTKLTLDDKKLTEIAEAMAETFGAVQSATDTTLRSSDKLYTPRDEWILSGNAAQGKIKSMKGKDITDASTWLFYLRTAVSAPGNRSYFGVGS